MKKLKALWSKIKSEDGMIGYPLAVVILLVLLIFISFIVDYIRVNSIAVQIRDKYESLLTGVAVQNYDNMYQPTREGYALSYKFNENTITWDNIDSITQENILDKLNYSFSDGEKNQVTISDIDFKISPEEVKITDEDQSFNISGKLTATIYYNGLWRNLSPAHVPIEVKSKWKMKF